MDIIQTWTKLIILIVCVAFLDPDIEDKNAQPVGKEKRTLKHV